MTTVELSGTLDSGTRTVKIAVTKIEEGFTSNPINFEIPQFASGAAMKTILVNLLKTKNTFTIYGKIGYDVDGTNNTWKCYSDLRDLCGSEVLMKDTLITMTINTSATITDAMNFKYPRSSGITSGTFTGLITKAAITHSPEDAVSSSKYNPDYVASTKQANVLDVIITFIVGELSGSI